MSTRYRRSPSVEVAPLQQELILYHPGANRFCLLNATAALVWERLAEPATLDELATAICASFAGVDRPTAERDVRAALQELETLTVIEPVA
jgi:hypothetical protein